VADSLIGAVNAEHDHDIRTHKTLWETLWENPRVSSAQEVFDELGVYGSIILQAGSCQVTNVENQAAILGTTAAELFGDAKYLTTKHPVTINQDGSVTVQEAP